jgi:hypothetical protein
MSARLGLLLLATLSAAIAPPLAAAFPGGPAAACPSAPLDPISLGNSQGASFRPGQADSVNRDSVSFQRDYTYQSQDGKYSVFLDPNSVAPLPSLNSFSFLMTVRANDGSGPACVFTVGEDPKGEFADFLADVTVKISTSSSSTPSIATVKVPVHSAGYDSDLELLADPNSSFVIVHLADSNPPGIRIMNRLSSFPIRITGVTASPGCLQCWTTGNSAFTPIEIPPGVDVRVPLNQQPRSFSALLATAFVLKKDSPHDTFQVTLDYNVELGGASRHKPINVPVRFDPSFPELSFAVLAGALIGTLLRWWLDPAHSRVSWKLALQSLGLAAMAEFISYIAATFDTKVVILGFDMDPRLFIPAVIISTLVAGGPIVAKFMGKVATGGFADAANVTPEPAPAPAGPKPPAGGN